MLLIYEHDHDETFACFCSFQVVFLQKPKQNQGDADIHLQIVPVVMVEKVINTFVFIRLCVTRFLLPESGSHV